MSKKAIQSIDSYRIFAQDGPIGATRYVSPDDWFDLVVTPDGLMGGWAEHPASFWIGAIARMLSCSPTQK
jgi:hypothetical protein